MKLKVSNIRIQYNELKQTELILTTKEIVHIEDLKEIIAKGKELSAEVKQFRNHRSLDSNGYMWVLLSKMAEVLKTTKDEVYLQVLSQYGVFTHIIVKPNVVQRVVQEWRTVRELGEVMVGGVKGIQIQCFFGSSSYDSKEMATLIDGVVSECKELEIETITPRELEEMKQAWGR